MSNFFYYLINTSICLATFYLCYYVVLRKAALFQANRIYLLTGLLASLVIPLLDLHTPLLPDGASQPVMEVLAIHNYVPDDFPYAQLPHASFPLAGILQVIYIGGVAFMLARFIFFMVRIASLVYHNPTQKTGNVRFVLLSKEQAIFSFFHFIFIHNSKINEGAASLMIEHERAHIRGAHSFDLVIAELATIILWFNPFIFFYRNAIKENHEYLADAKVIEAGTHPADYLTTLVREVFRTHFTGLVSHFNYSITKKRLLMLTKMNTSKKAGLRYLLVLPLLAVLLLAFTKPIEDSPRLLAFLPQLPLANQEFNTPCYLPIKETDISVSSGFGWRTHPIYKTKSFHEGMDMKAPKGTAIYAPAPGTVELAAECKGPKGYYIKEGMYIVIRHNAQFQTKYTHLSGFAVHQGDQVKPGQVIGFVGNTGFCTGPHLHYEVIKNGTPVDPISYIKKNL